MKYRPHIDGLRSVAVLSVVLFHIDAALVPGGYTGVDIFFVISGFLITRIVVDDLKAGRFSFLEFYKRRALRILPAYVAMISLVLAVSRFLLFPDETRAFGKSLAAASLFVSNIYFWRVSGYFDPDLETAPLLHTWTLAVEEQFYLFLPLFLVLVSRWLRGRYVLAIAVATLLSFMAGAWGVHHRSTATFFLIPTRAWEFGFGALAATTGLGGAGPFGEVGRRVRTILALMGASSILCGFVFLDSNTLFPGRNALWPVAGAMLLIAFAEGTPVGAILSTRPMVAVGRISYSVYLWHWPLIVYWRLEIPPTDQPVRVLLLLGLSLALGALSYRLVETPFRRGRIFPQIRALHVNAGALAVLLVAAGMGMLVSTFATHWGNISPEARRIAGYIGYQAGRDVHPCLIHARVPGGAAAFDPEICLREDDTRPTILVLGDSFSEHLLAALEETYPQFNFQAAASTGCPPFPGLEGDWYCPAVLRPVVEEHLPKADVDAVILSLRWRDEELSALPEAVAFLSSHVERVLILGPSPEYEASFPRLLARAERNDLPESSLGKYLSKSVRDRDRRMRQFDWGKASYVSLYDIVCPDDCRLTTAEGVPFHADYGHFTRAAAREVVRALDLPERILPRADRASRDGID